MSDVTRQRSEKIEDLQTELDETQPRHLRFELRAGRVRFAGIAKRFERLGGDKVGDREARVLPNQRLSPERARFTSGMIFS